MDKNKKYQKKWGRWEIDMDINPDEIVIKEKHNPFLPNEDRQYFVTAKHITTGITVTECDKSLVMAMTLVLTELERLVLIYEEQKIGDIKDAITG